MGVLSRGQLVPDTSSLSELSCIGGVMSPAVSLGISGMLTSDRTGALGG